MSRLTAYRALCATVGVVWLLAGLVFFLQFFAFHGPNAEPRLPTGPLGFYFIGFSGSLLIVWGGCLLGAARDPAHGRAVGTATAVGLVLCAVMRIGAWVVGDYYAVFGELPRIEAGVFLLVALALVWLRPVRAEAPA